MNNSKCRVKIGDREIMTGQGKRLFDVISEAGIDAYFPCGGKGTCGKCLADITDAKGTKRTVKACDYFIENDITVNIQKQDDIHILTSLHNNDITINPVIKKGEYGIAVDMGTTTVAAYLVNIRSGKIMDSFSCLNGQAVYGSDIISRIDYASDSEEHYHNIRKKLLDNINESIECLTKKNSIHAEDIYILSAAGNTVMMHFLLGLPVESLGRYPYIPASTKGTMINPDKTGIRINSKGFIYALDCISAYLGADAAAAAAASGMSRSREISLLIDIGTNGEILLGNDKWIIGCSAAAGPAFEGAHLKNGVGGISGAIEKISLSNGIKYSTIDALRPVGICGSGIVDIVAEMLDNGIIDRTGKFVYCRNKDKNDILQNRIIEGKDGAEFVVEYARFTDSGEDITVTQKDVREIQLAKSAISAAIRILTEEAGIEEEAVKKIYIAGGFGNYIRIESAVKIGLIPRFPAAEIVQIKNAAGAGAVFSIISKEFTEEVRHIAGSVKTIELTDNKKFQDYMVEEMYFK